MDAQTINLWVKSLGLGFTELVTDERIPNQPLVKSFADSNRPTLHPVEGLELLFNDTTQSLERILITLIPTVGQPVYAGGLPSPFALRMNQQSVRSALGEPMASRGTARFPGGLGMRGDGTHIGCPRQGCSSHMTSTELRDGIDERHDY